MKTIRTIGFTGTIASGKTSRCKHLLKVAESWQQSIAAAKGSGKNNATPSAALGSDRTMRPQAIPSSSALAVHYINADLVGHHIYEPGKPCYYDLLQHFGTAILTAPAPTKAASQQTGPPTQRIQEGAGRGFSAAGSGKAEPFIDRRVLGQIVFAEERKLQELNSICWPYITAAIKDEHAKVYATPAVGLVIVEAALLCEMTEVLELTTDLWMTHCTSATAVDRVMMRNQISREDAERRVASQLDVERKLLKLRHLPYKGDIEVFDTTQVSLEEGLKETEAAFERYWRKKIAVHL
ncbi:Dephospho-CoA kinase family protein [Leishmania donovani]|uniref:Dephospho-CoA kinase family protein n=1 Tax=Leishmania donovani TaxID=5661 RepID=A0A504Y323_LEIDO|nr:Dephospho-CoA kinase family protein [Leishmania donovani]